mmetsp:Transcript_84956/g.259414  ORF Transcript_84956/g.259414 Transcript_84956/m.259414 type:complete len:210 (+) Transcript_84956:70-699(+)
MRCVLGHRRRGSADPVLRVLQGPDCIVAFTGIATFRCPLAQLDLVRLALFPLLLDDALDVRLGVLVPDAHGSADRKSELVLGPALVEAVDQLLFVQVFADEDEAALPRNAGRPAGPLQEAAAEQHADALEHVLLIHAPHGEDALVSVKIGALRLQQHPEEAVQGVQIQIAFELAAHGGHALIVHVLPLCILELWVHLKDPVKAERAYAD